MGQGSNPRTALGSSPGSSEHASYHARKGDVERPGLDGNCAKKSILGAPLAARLLGRHSVGRSRWRKCCFVIGNLVLATPLCK